MPVTEIKKDIYWVGIVDWNIHDFHVVLGQSGLAQWAETPYSFLSMTKPSPYSEEQALTERWERQRELAGQLLALRQPDAAAADAEPAAALAATQAELVAAQAATALVSYEVSPRLVAEVISHWTGVPLAQLARAYRSQSVVR